MKFIFNKIKQDNGALPYKHCLNCGTESMNDSVINFTSDKALRSGMQFWNF